MKDKKLNRRGFLRAAGLAGLGATLAACQPKTVVVETEKVVTQVVEKEKVITQIVEKEGKTVVEEVVVTATPEPVEEGVAVEVLGAGGVVLNQWDGIGAADGLILTELLKGFTSENPEISVKRQIMGWNNMFDKLAAALVAGSGGPDIFVLWHSVVPQYAKPGHLYPAGQDLFDLGMLPKDDFLPQLLNAITVEGTMWTMPLDNYGVGVYLNLDLLEQAGIDPDKPPQDQTEWLEYARALTWDKNGKHPDESGFDPDNVEVWGWSINWPRADIQPALYQWGADIISRDDPPKVLIGSEGAIAATQFFVDAIYEHHVAPPPAGFNATEAFANNGIAMWPGGSWNYNWFPVAAPELRHGFWPYPRLGPERGSTIMWSHTFAISNLISPEKKDAALKQLQYLSDHSNLWTQKAGMPAARLSKREGLMDTVWTLPTFDAQFKKEGVMEFPSDRFTEVMGAVEPEWSAALNKDKTVEQALGDAAARIEQILS